MLNVTFLKILFKHAVSSRVFYVTNPVDQGFELVIQLLISGPYIDLCNQ